MKDIEIEISESTVKKHSQTRAGYLRLSKELTVLQALADSPFAPKVLSSTKKNGSISFTLGYIKGENVKQWLDLKEDWSTRKLSWEEVRGRLSQYVDAEMDLINRGALYRDMNLEHVIFSGSTAMLIDLESTILRDPNVSEWVLSDIRGTHETMAPEEFPGFGKLTERTATYRVAVIAFLALTGRIPFVRGEHRSMTYKWRKQHPPKFKAGELPMAVQRVFASALSRKPAHRQKNPESFFMALEESYDNK